MIALAKEDHYHPTADYVRKLRADALNRTYPDQTFFFLAPDISTQVLNFGLAAPIDIQVLGAIGNEEATYAVAEQIAERVKRVPGAADVHLAQVPKQPELRVDVNRTMAGQLGLTERDVASDLLVSLASSAIVAPSYWLDKRGVQYLVAVQTPQAEVNSLEAMSTTPISTGGTTPPQLLSNMASLSRTEGPVNITHYNVARTFDVQANVDGTDLGSVASGVQKVVDELKLLDAARDDGEGEGASREHGVVLPRARLRADLRGRPRLHAHGRELPVVARPARHLDGHSSRGRSRGSHGCSFWPRLRSAFRP